MIGIPKCENLCSKVYRIPNNCSQKQNKIFKTFPIIRTRCAIFCRKQVTRLRSMWEINRTWERQVMGGGGNKKGDGIVWKETWVGHTRWEEMGNSSGWIGWVHSHRGNYAATVAQAYEMPTVLLGTWKGGPQRLGNEPCFQSSCSSQASGQMSWVLPSGILLPLGTGPEKEIPLPSTFIKTFWNQWWPLQNASCGTYRLRG